MDSTTGWVNLAIRVFAAAGPVFANERWMMDAFQYSPATAFLDRRRVIRVQEKGFPRAARVSAPVDPRQ